MIILDELHDATLRLFRARMGIGSSLTERFSYDKMGNILELDRNFSGGSAGQLRFVYDGNHLSGCSDINTTFPIPEKYKYLKYPAMGNNSYLYDLNGNEVMNLSQGMSYAHYNNINLPDSVVFLYGNSLSFRYTADGRRVRTRGQTYSTPMSVPYDEGDFYGTPLAVFDEVKCGSLTLNGGFPVRYDFAGGYYSLQNDTTGNAELHPYLYETDLQGSVRIVRDAMADSVVQSMEYLPDGSIFRAENYPQQPYRYGGKEEVALHGWNMCDSHARWQYARLPRFAQTDPLAEKYYHISPYAYCGNDFVNYVDPSGEDPGDWFATPDAAAIDFGKLFNDNSIRENREYSSFIIKIVDDNGNMGYTYNIPKRGKSTSVNNNPVPYGIPIVASVHTHAAYDKKYHNNMFSGVAETENATERLLSKKGDLFYANKSQIDNYVATPNGSLQRYNHKNGKITIVSNEMPSDLNDPDRLNNVNSIETKFFTWNDFIRIKINIDRLINNYYKNENRVR